MTAPWKTACVACLVLIGVAGAAAQQGGGGAPVVPVDPAPGGAVVWAVGDAATPTSAARRWPARFAGPRPDRFLYLGDVYEQGTAPSSARLPPLYGPLRRSPTQRPGTTSGRGGAAATTRTGARTRGGASRPGRVTAIAGWELVASTRRPPTARARARSPGFDVPSAVAPGTAASPSGTGRATAPATTATPATSRSLWNALRGRARAVLSGHDHNLERLHPIRGIVQYVAGAGGQARYEVDRGDPRVAFGNSSRYGALRIVLEPGVATFEFRDVRGRLLDRSRSTCSATP